MKQNTTVRNVRRNVSVRRKDLERQKALKRYLIGAAVVGLIAVGAAGTFVYKFNTSDATIAAGNKAFAAQQYKVALEKYASAQASAPVFAEPFYNAANVLYKQGAFEQAQPLLEQALTRSNEKIVEFIQYNLGNVAYNAQQYEQAIARYEDALRLNPDDADAKHNLELALLQKQQQDQQNQQQNQDQQNQDQQNQDEQNQNQQNQNQDSQDQQQNGQQGQDQQQQNGQQGQDQQQQNGQQGQQDQQQNGQQGQQDQQQQNGQQGQQQNQPPQKGQPQNAQNQAGQQGQQQQANGATPGQPSQEQGNEQGTAYVPGELTQEQAEQLLAAIGGNTQTLLEALQQYLYVPGDEPEKDW